MTGWLCDYQKLIKIKILIFIIRQKTQDLKDHLINLENCERLKATEFILAAEASAITKFDMSNCKIFSETILMNPVVLYFRKHHYLVEAVDRKISIFKEAGLIYFWISRFDKDSRKKKECLVNGPKVMSLHDLSGTFKVWLYGLLISVTVFVLETLKRSFMRCCRHRIRRLF